MIEEPDLDKRIRIGIREILFSAFLEIVGGDLVGVGHNPMDYFEAVTIGLVFKMPAHSVE